MKKRLLYRAVSELLIVSMLAASPVFADGTESQATAEVQAVESKAPETEKATEAATVKPAETQKETEKATEARTEKPVETTTEATTEKPVETQKETEKQTESESHTKEEPATESSSEKATEKDTEKETEKHTETDISSTETHPSSGSEEGPSASESSKADESGQESSTPAVEGADSDEAIGWDPESERLESLLKNQALIKRQHIVVPTLTEEEKVWINDFRFAKAENVEKKYLLENSFIYEATNTDSKMVGRALTAVAAYVLKDVNEDWAYVESGLVRGFTKKKNLMNKPPVREEETMINPADRIVDKNVNTEDVTSKDKPKGLDDETFADPTACALVSPMDNAALTYTMTSAYDPIAEKKPALAAGEMAAVYDFPDVMDIDTKMVGMVPAQGLVYVLDEHVDTRILDSETEEEWMFVESGDVRGFVRKEAFFEEEDAQALMDIIGEEEFEMAEALIEPEENKALYYRINSVSEKETAAVNQKEALRQEMVKFALSHLGNPYVWGGTNLETGADCSGFVMQIYKKYGYEIPRTSRSQSVYGMQIPIEYALPGDLIFYAKYGEVYHVSMYIGNGKVVHASNPRMGVISNGITRDAVWACRIIK